MMSLLRGNKSRKVHLIHSRHLEVFYLFCREETGHHSHKQNGILTSRREIHSEEKWWRFETSEPFFDPFLVKPNHLLLLFLQDLCLLSKNLSIPFCCDYSMMVVSEMMKCLHESWLAHPESKTTWEYWSFFQIQSRDPEENNVKFWLKCMWSIVTKVVMMMASSKKKDHHHLSLNMCLNYTFSRKVSREVEITLQILMIHRIQDAVKHPMMQPKLFFLQFSHCMSHPVSWGSLKD